MTGQDSKPPERSYGCSYGCGNPYDFVMVTVSDGASEFLCTPCLIKTATEMVAAMIQADNPEVRAALESLGTPGEDRVPGPAGRERGENGPAGSGITVQFEEYSPQVDSPGTLGGGG